jgi:Tfp pilus assembly protein PilF
MRWPAWTAGLALAVAGCATTVPERVRDYNEDGVYLYQRGDYAHARECFQAALALQPGDPDLLYNVGQCHDRLGQDARAEPYYRECLERSPNQPDCRHALAVLLVRQGRRADAERMVQEWMARESRLAAPCAEQGWLLLEAGNLPQAQAYLQRALALDPHDNRSLIEMGRVYEAMHRLDLAVTQYEHALEYRPGQPAVAQRVSLLRSQGAGRPRPD